MAALRHTRHYSVEQANASLDWVLERLERLRAARRDFVDDDARTALAEAAPANGGGEPGRIVGEAFVALDATASELRAMDIVVRDLDRGLIDFPALRDDREVYLCWEQGEPEVAFWHELEAGHAGRQPI